MDFQRYYPTPIQRREDDVAAAASDGAVPTAQARSTPWRYGFVWVGLMPILGVAVIGGLWQLTVMLTSVRPEVLPPPRRVLSAGWDDRVALWQNLLPTLKETVLGIVATVAFAVVLAVACDFSAVLRRLVYPILVIAQTVPVIVIAPLMVIWFGFGLLPKIIMIILVTFFAITVALTDGFKSTPPGAMDLMRTMGANRWSQFLKARLPSALPNFFTGLRIAITWSVASAVFAEWVGSESGLGVYMQLAKNGLRTDLVLAAVILTAIVSLALYGLVYVAERFCIPWQHKMNRSRGR